MKNYFKPILFVVCLLAILAFSGCGVDKDDDHYKPAEYKHNVALNKANQEIQDVKKAINALTGDTAPATVRATYQESINSLNGHLAILKANQRLLSKEDTLNNSEIKTLNKEYNDTIRYVNEEIQYITKKQTEYVK